MNVLWNVPNPFDQSIVCDVWARTPTLPDLHQRALHLGLRCLEDVKQSQKTTSLLIHGEAGSGKTHLVTRLRDEVANLPSPPAICWVRLGTSASQLWSHLRRCLVTDLLRPVQGQTTQLDQILVRRFGSTISSSTSSGGILDVLFGSPNKNTHIRKQLQQLSQECDLDREVRQVLVHLKGELEHDARDWLLGELLGECALQKLGLTPRSSTSYQGEQYRSARVVKTLCRIAGSHTPLVFCFDNIESLQSGVSDQDSLKAFSQIVAELFEDTHSTLLLISLIRSDYQFQLKKADDAGWARLGKHVTSLNPLKWEEAVQLISLRLDSDPQLKAMRHGQPDVHWPLGKEWLQKTFNAASDGFTPRRLLDACKLQFDKRKGVVTPPNTLDQFLNATWQQKHQQATGSYGNDQFIATLEKGLPWLLELFGGSHAKLPPLSLHLTEMNLVLEIEHKRLGLCFCNDPTVHRKLYNRLGRIGKQWETGKLDRLAILRGKADHTTEKNEEQLTELDFRNEVIVYRPEKDCLVALKTLVELLEDTHQGSMVHNGEAISAQQVHHWAIDNIPMVLKEMLNEAFGQDLLNAAGILHVSGMKQSHPVGQP